MFTRAGSCLQKYQKLYLSMLLTVSFALDTFNGKIHTYVQRIVKIVFVLLFIGMFIYLLICLLVSVCLFIYFLRLFI